MKIVISHDVDHLHTKEHFGRGLFLLKTVIRSLVEFTLGNVGLIEVLFRILSLVKGRLNNIKELVKFNEDNEIPATFFFGMSNGLSLNYSVESAKYYIDYLVQRNVDVGVHGIAFSDVDKMREEKERFASILGSEDFGIRMHYLRFDETTMENIESLGYTYDASSTDFRSVFHNGRLAVFPVHIMDSWMINGSSKYQKSDLDVSKELTIRALERGKEMQIDYFSILFHDCYFSRGYSTWRNWYIWLIDYLKKEGYEFVSHNEAVQNL